MSDTKISEWVRVLFEELKPLIGKLIDEKIMEIDYEIIIRRKAIVIPESLTPAQKNFADEVMEYERKIKDTKIKFPFNCCDAVLMLQLPLGNNWRHLSSCKDYPMIECYHPNPEHFEAQGRN